MLISPIIARAASKKALEVDDPDLAEHAKRRHFMGRLTSSPRQKMNRPSEIGNRRPLLEAIVNAGEQ